MLRLQPKRGSAALLGQNVEGTWPIYVFPEKFFINQTPYPFAFIFESMAS